MIPENNIYFLITSLLLSLMIPGFALGQENLDNSKWECNCNHLPDTLQGLKVMTVCEKSPEFAGGNNALIKYLRDNISYPVLAQNEIVQSSVYISFIIDTTGKVTHVCLAKSLNENKCTEIEKVVLRVVANMPDWIPGEQEGSRVPVRFNLPIHIDFNK